MRILAVEEQAWSEYQEKAALMARDFTASAFRERAMSAESGEFARHGDTAIIPVAGLLTRRYDLMTYLMGGTSYLGITNQINAALADSAVSRIALAIDSGGGEVTGCPECAESIFEARKTKDIVAVVDPLAASAAYWIASQANTIVSLGSGQVGSIGVMGMYVSNHKALESAGIDVELIRSSISPLKNLGAEFEEKTEASRNRLQTRVDALADLFVSDIARGRNVSASKITEDFGRGDTMFAREAIAAGMVDEIGTLSDMLVSSKPAARKRRGRNYSMLQRSI